jgi:hypothetical protein
VRTQLNSLERHYDRLTAKERAILSLKAWKNDEEPDEALKRSTPQHDVRMVSSHLRAVSKTGLVVGGLASWLEAKLEGLELRLALVAAMHLREIDRDRLDWLVRFDLPEVLTESEAAAQILERRAEPFTFEEAAWHLADHELDDGDLARDVKRQEKRLRAAVKAGELQSARGKVLFGDLLDWNGETLAPWANDGLHVAVLPDSASDYAEKATAARGALRALAAEDERLDGLREGMLRTAAAHLCEAETTRLSLEAVIAWAAEDFSGEEPVHPTLRDQLDAIAAVVTSLVEKLSSSGCEVALPEAGDEEMVETLQRAIATN